MQTPKPITQAILSFIRNSFDNSFLDSVTQDFIRHIQDIKPDIKLNETTNFDNANKDSNDTNAYMHETKSSTAHLLSKISLNFLKDSSFNVSNYLYENLFAPKIDEEKLEFFLPCFYASNDKIYIFGFFGEGDYMLIEALTSKRDINSISVLSLQYAISLLLALRSNIPIVVILHEADYIGGLNDSLLIDSVFDDANRDCFSTAFAHKDFISNSLYANYVCIEHFFVDNFSCICKDNLLLSCASLLLETRNLEFKDKLCAIAGDSSLCLELVRGLCVYGAKPLTISNNKGLLYDSNSLNPHFLQSILKQITAKCVLPGVFCREDLLEIYASSCKCDFIVGANIASIPCSVVLLGADQIVQIDTIKALLGNGCKYIIELYPSLDLSAQRLLLDSRICCMPFCFVGCVYFMRYMYDKRQSIEVKSNDIESSSIIELNRKESIINSFSLLLHDISYGLLLDSNIDMRFIGMQEILAYILDRNIDK